MKLVEKLIKWKKQWHQIAIRINWQAINDVKQNSSTKSKVGDIIHFATGATFINSEVKKVTKR